MRKLPTHITVYPCKENTKLYNIKLRGQLYPAYTRLKAHEASDIAMTIAKRNAQYNKSKVVVQLKEKRGQFTKGGQQFVHP